MHAWKRIAAVSLMCAAVPFLSAAQTEKPATEQVKPDAKQDAQRSAKTDSNEDNQRPSKPVVVDGRVHPELIPDTTACRIVFEHLSATAGDPEYEKVWFGVPGLNLDDQEMLLRIMTAYKKEWDEIVRTYNDASEAAWRKGKPPAPSVLETFRAKQAELIQQTRRDLDAALSPNGAERFHSYVEQQKHKMVVTLEPWEEKEDARH